MALPEEYDQYAYNGKDSFLYEFREHKALFVSIASYLVLFFITIYTIGQDTLWRFETNGDDLKNSSLYLFAAQAALIGLVFPIIISYVSLVNTGRASSDILIYIYKRHTGFSILINSSFALLAFYACFFVFDFILNEYIFTTLAIIFLFWFLMNLLFLFFFLSKTMDFISTSKKIDEVIKCSYNDESMVKNCLLVIIDEMKYFLEKKSIPAMQKVEFKLIEFIEVNFIKHKMKLNDLDFFLRNVRHLFDYSLDYNDVYATKLILYIYYHVGCFFNRVGLEIPYSKLISYQYYLLFNLDDKVNLSEGFKSKFYLNYSGSWSSFTHLLKSNKSIIEYAHYTFLIISFYLDRNIRIDNILDLFLRAGESVGQVHYSTKSLEVVDESSEEYTDQTVLNYLMDIKFILIRRICDSKLESSLRENYINCLIRNKSPLQGTVSIHSHTHINQKDSVLLSFIRVASNRLYSQKFSKMYDDSFPSELALNRAYWVKSSDFINSFSEVYAYVYDNATGGQFYIEREIVKCLGIHRDQKLLDNFHQGLSNLEQCKFTSPVFDSKKRQLLMSKFIKDLDCLEELIENSLKLQNE